MALIWCIFIMSKQPIEAAAAKVKGQTGLPIIKDAKPNTCS
jgi:hypothetical protein